MKQIAIVLVNLLFIVTLSIQTQTANWTTNPNIDAGEVVTANVNNSTTLVVANTINKPLSKNYNRTTFTSIPRVILGLIGFSQDVPASSNQSFGFHVEITSIGLLGFSYNLTTYGTKIYDLRFLCLAIQYQTSAYYTQIVSKTFDSTTNLGNSGAAQRWQTFAYLNPGGWVNTNYLTSDFQIVAFPIGYQLTAQSGRNFVSINGSLLNDSHYSVNISTIGNNILSMLDFSIIMFNRLPITANYSVYVDVSMFNVIKGNATYFPPVVTSLQYQYRNSISGATHIDFNLSGATNMGFFYGTASPIDHFFVWRSVNNRVRVCPSNLTFYQPINVTCQDQCISSSAPNTLKICIPCAYSCLTCYQGNTTTNCSSCSGLSNRYLSNASCLCISGFYQNGTAVCPSCDYRCLTCHGGTSTSCLTCNATLLRVWNHSTKECLCNNTLYQNNTCLSCSSYASWCTSCSFNLTTSNFTCLSCNSTVNRVLSADNKSCMCETAYYEDSSLVCQLCPLGCLSCSLNVSQILCSSCDPSLSKVLSSSNTSCVCSYGTYQHTNQSCLFCINNCLTCTSDIVCTSCPLGYYLHSNNSCVVCSVGCLSCQFSLSTSSQVCLNCSSSLNFQLQSPSCVCMAGTALMGASCNSTNTTNNRCGNGVLQVNEQCDDSNVISSDGCSSTCLVQLYHTCINNNTLYNASLCYYSRQIELQTKLIYKIPGLNSVQLKLYVNAPNCNPSHLKSYLEKTTYLNLYDRARLLLQSKRQLQGGPSWVSISAKSIVFDPTTNVLVITFDYEATIDLTKKYIQFVPSSSTNQQGVKYFYASPTAQLALQQPYNHLSTTYYNESDLTLVKNVKYFFLILVILYWIFLIITFTRKRGAVGTECMLVLQFTYFTLIDQPKLVESWSGFQLTGKYSFGYNPQLMPASHQRHLKALEIDSNILNILNVTLAIELFLFFTILIYKLNEYYRQRKRREKIMEMEQSQGNHTASPQASNEKLTVVDRVMAYVIDIFLSFLFLITGVFVISVVFTTSVNLVSNMIEGVIILLMSVVFWILYYRNKQGKVFLKISYLSIVINSSKTSFNSMLKAVINHYYIILYCALIVVSALISLMRNYGIAIFAIIITGSIVAIIFQLKYPIYFQSLDSKRCIMNSIGMMLVMMVHIISSVLGTSLGTGFSMVLVSYIILLIVLILNVVIFIVVTRKQRKRQAQEQIHNQQMKQMDNELALANISFIGAGYNSINSINKSRDFTKDKDFINSLDYSSARKLLLGNAKGEQQLKMIEEKIKQLKDFKKNIIQGIEQSRSVPDISEGNNLTLENVLGALDITNEVNQIEDI